MNNKELKTSLILLGFEKSNWINIHDWVLKHIDTGITVRYSSKEFINTAYKAWGIEEKTHTTNCAKEVLDLIIHNTTP